jgi:hypothetical protein
LSTSTTTTITTHPKLAKKKKKKKTSPLQQITTNKQDLFVVGLLLLFVCLLCCMGATYESEQGIYLTTQLLSTGMLKKTGRLIDATWSYEVNYFGVHNFLIKKKIKRKGVGWGLHGRLITHANPAIWTLCPK